MNILLQIQGFGGEPVADSGVVWKFTLALVIISLLTFIRVQYSHRLITSFKALSGQRYLRQLTRDDLNIFHPYSVLSFIVLCLCAAIPLWFTLRSSGAPEWIRPEWRMQEWVNILVLSLLIGAWLVVRSAVFLFTYYVLGVDGGQVENRYAQLIFSQVLAFAITPLALTALFAKGGLLLWVSWLALGLLVANYLFRLVRGVLAAWNQGIHPVYIIYYLCTLEIVPVLLLVGVLQRYAA